ncbi:GYF domain protein [Medicago truncatula]|uniref:GYF domain protein n=1 Tax=Medicago truncatula TaxID=3880 RepID=A0A072UAG4_MEDTR|nr:GYF domain protein [Medicago truncatula]
MAVISGNELIKLKISRAKLKTPEEQERLLREFPQVIAEDLESESATPDVPEKKLPTNFQELSQTTCTKVSLATEVPKAAADDFSDEDDFADDQEWLFHDTPQVTTGYPEFSKSKTPEIPDKKAENNIQGIWEATCMTASIEPEVPKVVSNGPQVTAGYPEFSKSKTPEIPDKKAENNMQGIWEATSMTGSIVPEVPKVVADGIPQGTTGYPKFSKSKTPEIPDKKAENNLQGFWEATCMTGSIVPEVPKVVANGIPQVTTGYLDFSKSKTPEVPVKKTENNMQGFWEANCIEASVVPEVPKAVANSFVFMGKRFHVADQTKQESESPKSILSLSRPSEVPLFNIAMNNTASNGISRDTVTSTVHQRSSMSVQQQPATQTFSSFKKDGVFMPAKSNEVTIKAKNSQGTSDKQVRPAQIQVIELSDDDDEEIEKSSTIKPSFITPVPVENPHSSTWNYIDPQGNVQGPFPLFSLKCWNDSRYFSPDFKVWKAGQTQDQSVLLVDILSKYFPVGPSFM